MSGQGVWSECFSVHPLKLVIVETSGGRLSSDAGLLLIWQRICGVSTVPFEPAASLSLPWLLPVVSPPLG